MDFLEINYHDTLAEYVEYPLLNLTHYLNVHWRKDVLREERGYHRRDEKTSISSNICFTLEDKYIELSNSFIEEEPDVELLSDFDGKARTLSMICKFRIPNIKILGKINILTTSNSPLTSDYTLQIKNIEITTVTGFHIRDDSYLDDYFIDKFEKADMSFQYKDGLQTISLLDKVEDKRTRCLLEDYILKNCTREILSAMKNIFMKFIYDRGSVSTSLGNDYALRDVLRIHEKTYKVAFNIFIDKVVEITNRLIKEESPVTTLSKIFCVVNRNEKEKMLKVFEGSIKNLNSLERTRNPIILLENELIFLYILLDFNALQIEYKDGNESKTMNYKTVNSHMKISLKKLQPDKAEINFLAFKIDVFFPLSKSENELILDYHLSSILEEKMNKYLTQALKNSDVNALAIHPPNVEIEYDSDDIMDTDSES